MDYAQGERMCRFLEFCMATDNNPAIIDQKLDWAEATVKEILDVKEKLVNDKLNRAWLEYLVELEL
jgi:hypothetical protein